jgi:hypothetical protein
MRSFLAALLNIFTKYRGYRPQAVTLRSLWLWLKQFPKSIRPHLLLLLNYIIYISEKETSSILVNLNNHVMEILASDGIEIDSIIYVSIDEAGSSSPVMLNLLRDTAKLERKGAHLVDSKDIIRLNKLTGDIGVGAIIYVDDFAATGNQFSKNRKWVSDYIVGSFSEFFIAPCMCEEAVECIKSIDVFTVPGFVHRKEQRPLHEECNILKNEVKELIVEQCRIISPTAGLGFGNLATMVVMYRNAPNTMPLVFRGSLEQRPYRGIFPRWRDLPT